MNITREEAKLIDEKIRQFAEMLNEMGCDSISVMATYRCGGGTDYSCCNLGNYYARVGLMRDYLEAQEPMGLEPAMDEGDEDDSGE